MRIGLRTGFFLVLVFTSFSTHCQNQSVGFTGTVNHSVLHNGKMILKEGQNILMFHVVIQDKEARYPVSSGESTVSLYYQDLKNLGFDKPGSLDDLWLLLQTTNGSFENLARFGPQETMRKGMQEDARRSLEDIRHREGLVDDPYINGYVDLLLRRLLPHNMGILPVPSPRVVVMNVTDPVSFCLPDGTIVLSAGEICQLRSEQELMSVIARETAHLLLDQPVINLNATISRNKKADFWVVFSTIMAAASEIAMNNHQERFPHIFIEPGDMSFLTSSLSGLIADAVTEKMGNQFNQQQDQLAGSAAMDVLDFIGMDPYALNRADERTNAYFNANENSVKAGKDSLEAFNDRGYDIRISSLISATASLELKEGHAQRALALVTRNLECRQALQNDLQLRDSAIEMISRNKTKTEK